MSIADELMSRARDRTKQMQRLPESTYRLQFHAGFTFKDAQAIVAYLHDLGITHCYASPYLRARPGSLHGYDIIDHRTLNPEIGTAEDYEALVAELHAHDMGQILDMVPNHMGIVGNANLWWNDVLENGRSSPYAGHFDIAWEDSPRPELHDYVLLPTLGEPYGKVLEAKQIQLAYGAGSFSINYFDNRFPVAPSSYALILGHDVVELERILGADSPALQEYKSILTAVTHLPDRHETDAQKIEESQREKEVIKRRLTTLTRESEEVRALIEKTVALFNGKEGDPHSFDLLEELLDQQAYRLSNWRVAADEINYRRFFDVNELAALSMEKLDVFTASHDLVLRYCAQGKIDGLRIDHPDGLYDPKQYLKRLQDYYLLYQAHAVFDEDPQYRGMEWKDLEPQMIEQIELESQRSDPLFVVVEKILVGSEEFPSDWQAHGTSGYDFLTALNCLFIDAAGEQPLTRFYYSFVNDDTSFSEMAYAKKYLVLQNALSSELHMLGRQLDRIAQKNRYSRDFTQNSLRFALRHIIASFPVYRSYISEEGVHDTDKKYVELAVRKSIRRNPTVSRSLFRFIRDMLLLKYPETSNEQDRAEQRRFAGKFQQVTSPVTAKGVEDTTFYVYNRLLSLNEVGGDPQHFGTSVESLHRWCQNRQAKAPFALSPLSTHDTKRSEDVRARLNVLSELPQEWSECVGRWQKLNEQFRATEEDDLAPDANEEYFIYQTLLGAWPLEESSPKDWEVFVGRIQAYVAKALHEAKVHTSWINPNESYDAAIGQFLEHILDRAQNSAFIEDFSKFQKKISYFGMLNSLSQTVLKYALPGVPDTYQGTELWDFSLVDPDNRRPVDYAKRQAMLKALDTQKPSAALLHELLKTMSDGRIKLYVTMQSLRCRREHPRLFSSGEYLPLEVTGARRDNVFAFARRQAEEIALVVVPRLFTQLAKEPFALPSASAWGDTSISLAQADPSLRWRDIFSGVEISVAETEAGPSIAVGQLLTDVPFALLLASPKA